MAGEDLQGVGNGAATGFSVGGPWGAAIGAALDLLGGHKAEQNANAQRQVEVAKALTNPWLKMTPTGVASPDVLGKTIAGGAQGLSAAQKLSSWNRENAQMPNRAPAVVGDATALDPSSQSPWFGLYPQGQGALR